MFSRHISKQYPAFTLIEVLATIAILLVGLLAAFSTLMMSIRSGSDTVSRTVATHLATEGLELVRSVREKNKIGGLPWNAEMNNGACADIGTTCTYLIERSLSVPASGGSLCQVGSAQCATVIPLDFVSGQYGYNGWGIVGGTPSRFTRTVEITHYQDADLSNVTYLSVRSRVTWAAGKQVVLETHLYDWRP